MIFTMKDLQKFVRNLPKTLNDACVRGIRKGAQAAIPVLQRSGDRAPPASQNGHVGAFDTGRYRRSWKVMNLPTGAQLYNAAPYAGVIEMGRRKNSRQPPSKAIEVWAKRRLGLSAEEAKAAAFPIARAIGKRGLRPRKVEKTAEPEATKVVVREMLAEVARALRSGR